jgi:hypothetical protein
MTNSEITQLIDQLNSAASAKRRSAAKKLRKLKSFKAGSNLLEALQKELKDKRTWETQYQMIMALGESEYIKSLDFLIEIAEQEFEATMIYVAIGDAITRLEIASTSIQFPASLATWIKKDKKIELINGGLRALAMLHLVPSTAFIQNVIQYVSLPSNQDLEFWTTAATPGWPANLTKTFLENIIISTHLEDTKKAAKAALKGKYSNWNPL